MRLFLGLLVSPSHLEHLPLGVPVRASLPIAIAPTATRRAGPAHTTGEVVREGPNIKFLGGRRAGARLLGPALLVGGAAIFAIDHAARYSPIGMVVFLVGAVVTERARGQRSPVGSEADRLAPEPH
jgi:hypothetical protein